VGIDTGSFESRTGQIRKPLPVIMTTDRNLKIIFGLLSIGLLATLLIKLTNVPGGMILSGLFLGGMMIIGIIIGCLIVTGILRLIFKKTSFLTIFYITTAISFIVFHYQLYSPTLTIIVPNGYRGEINLVLSNVEDNELKVDSNGIGYVNEWTFNKTYSRPIVKQFDGENLDNNLVGFNPSTFWAKGESTSSAFDFKLETLSFEILKDDNQKKNTDVDLFRVIDVKKIIK
jgi:hypothetical protein